MDSIKNIWEGWRNSIIPPKELKEKIEETAKERLAICEDCIYNSNRARKELDYKSARFDYHCTQCQCPLNKKTRCLSCECPLKKWTAVLTENENEEIKNQLNIEE